jgi:hypoxanthine phosphoribosyltransferase
MTEVTLHDLTFEPFISSAEIDRTVASLAAQIDNDYRGRNPILLIVLNGAFIFAADLVRKISIPIRLDFVKISSYKGTTSSGKMNEHFLWKSSLEGENVIIVEDIVDTGNTLHYLLDKIHGENPASVEIVCLLKKPTAYRYPDQPRYEGMAIPDKFVVGYGLDYNGLGRDLESIYCRKEI